MKRILIVIALLCGVLHSAAAWAGPQIVGGELRQALERFVQQKTAGLGWETTLRNVTVNGTFAPPAGPLDYEVIAPQQWEGWGNASLAVVVRQNGRIVANLPVRIDVEALTTMVVATRQIGYGTVIAASDLALQKREISSVTGRYARTVDEAIGKKARTSIKANQVVRLDQVEKPPLITTGQLVTIVAESDAIRITVSGRAKSAGAEGDMIMVQNLTSMKEFPAKVLNPTTVQVSF